MSEFIHLNVGEEVVITKRLTAPEEEPFVATSGTKLFFLYAILFIGLFFGHRFDSSNKHVTKSPKQP